MKSAFNRSILALAAILVVAAAGQASAQGKLKSYQSGTKEFWTHPPDDWFLGDETEAQKGLAPPSGPPTGASESELVAMMKKIKLPPGTNSAEFQLSHGMIDKVVHRRELRDTVAKLLSYLAPVVDTSRQSTTDLTAISA